jgi:hypothetical protein
MLYSKLSVLVVVMIATSFWLAHSQYGVVQPLTQATEVITLACSILQLLELLAK